MQPNEYPMMAALYDGDRILCGAVLVSSRHALSSAHCLRGQSMDMVDLIVGEFDSTMGKRQTATTVFSTRFHAEENAEIIFFLCTISFRHRR